MKKCKMKQLALAMGVALGGMSLMPSAQAVNLATDGLGQVLIFPYYTTRAGWTTLFNITNTSNQVVAIKVRFHEGLNSRDVFDFNVIMSPFDVWNGWVENGEGNTPVFKTEDKTCTVPSLPSTGVSFSDGILTNGVRAYTGDAADGGPTDTDRMREGYLEVVMMGATSVSPVVGGVDPIPYSRGAIHVNGNPPGCQKLVNGFTDPGLFFASGTGSLSEEFTNYAGLNPLKGFYTLVNGDKGLVAGGSAVTLANFSTVPLVTMQQEPAKVAEGVSTSSEAFALSYHEPSLNSADTTGTVLNSLDFVQDNPTTISPYTGVDAVSWLFLRDNVINHFTKRTDSSGWTTASDWVITHPTKAFYVDRGPSEFAAINPFRGERTQVPGTPSITSPFAGYFANVAFGPVSPPDPASLLPTTPVRNGKSCDSVSLTLWDREEKSSLSPVFSPAPVGQNLCYEVNVLTFDNSKVLGSGTTITNNISAASLPARTGWMRIGLGTAANRLGSDLYGRPVIGFSVTTRDTGDGNLNEAYLIDHSYTRIETD